VSSFNKLYNWVEKSEHKKDVFVAINNSMPTFGPFFVAGAKPDLMYLLCPNTGF
jgi:hypothetical protein